ncbi:MAG: pyrophosphatase, partial [Desulfobacterales bacterium]|nr:pyrophosphatase [Desulfobacterales bacterium]
MSAHALNQFLVESKTNINYKPVDYLVMGSEAADLDSMASALAYAFLLAAREKNKAVVPIMPILRAD